MSILDIIGTIVCIFLAVVLVASTALMFLLITYAQVTERGIHLEEARDDNADAADAHQ